MSGRFGQRGCGSGFNHQLGPPKGVFRTAAVIYSRRGASYLCLTLMQLLELGNEMDLILVDSFDPRTFTTEVAEQRWIRSGAVHRRAIKQ